MAQLIDKDSVEASNSLLGFFDVPPTSTTIESSYWHAARPLNTLSNDGPYKFMVPAGPDYLHLARNYLYLKFKIVKADGSDANHNGALDGQQVVEGAQDAGEQQQTDSHIGVINAFGKTFIKQMKVYVEGKQVNDSGDMYANRVMMETDLNYGWESKSTWFETFLYAKDHPPNASDSADNTGWLVRKDLVKNSSVVETMAPLHCDLFSVDKLMLSNTQLFIELYRNSDAFCLLGFGNENYKIEVIDMVWYVKKLQLLSSVHLGLETALMKMPVKYPIKRVVMTKIHVGGGRLTTPTNSIFEGQLPRRIIIGFVEPEALVGNYKKSPFTYKNHGVTQICVHAGGQIIPREPLRMDFAKNQFTRAYVQFVETLGMNDDTSGNHITMADYRYQNCLFAFDLTPEQCASDTSWQLVRQGSVSVHAEFKEAIKENGLEMVIYSEFDNLCMIDRNRSVYFDYSV
jgi:hypothetical protein